MDRRLRFSGVAAVVCVWTILSTAVVLAEFDLLGAYPLSHLGSRPESAVLFTLGLAVPAVLLTVFHGYVRSHYPVARGFSFVMLAGLAGQVVAAFVPIGGDAALHGIHTVSALVLGASLPLLMWRFAAAQPGPTWRRLTYGLFWAEVVACIVGFALSARDVAPVAEILPGAVFHVWVITVTIAGSIVGARRMTFRAL
ncbi:MAG: hypothetical protein ACRD12_05785 [Acidimicrobiales bacterium]